MSWSTLHHDLLWQITMQKLLILSARHCRDDVTGLLACGNWQFKWYNNRYNKKFPVVPGWLTTSYRVAQQIIAILLPLRRGEFYLITEKVFSLMLERASLHDPAKL